MSRWKNRTMTSLVAGALSASALVAGPTSVAEAAPTYRFSTVVSGLEIPWDVTWVGGAMLYDLRAGGVWSKRAGAAPRKVQIKLPTPYVQSEGGLLGMVADPHAATNRRFYTCSTAARTQDVRVLAWKLDDDTHASQAGTLITGIPLTSGRHSGCRLRFSPQGMLYVGTGDAATRTNPQRISSLGGKVLRVSPNGTIPRTNPFYGRGGNARYVWNYGHRNVQGLAVQPGTGRLFSAEQGTDRDDEVNLVHKGANYGWNPGSPGYNENRPMTDRKKFPKAVRAVWSSGYPTLATSGITFLSGSAWGSWNGALAVAQLKGTGIRLIFLDRSGHLTSTKMMPGTTAYGRVRTVQQGPDGALYFTTSEGSGDKIVRVTPR